VYFFRYLRLAVSRQIKFVVLFLYPLSHAFSERLLRHHALRGLMKPKASYYYPFLQKKTLNYLTDSQAFIFSKWFLNKLCEQGRYDYGFLGLIIQSK
jgi:hypothetical protein